MSKNSKNYQAPTHEEIAICAQAIYEREGRPQGRATQHWLEAEAQLIAERKAAAGSLHKQPEPKPSTSPEAKHQGKNWQAAGRQTLQAN